MPAFAYTGLNSSGRTIKGIESHESVGALKAALKRKGIYLTAVTESAAGVKEKGSSSSGIDFSAYLDRVTNKLLARVTRLLGTLLCAGVTLPESIDALIEQVESAKLKGILSDIGGKVREGSALADAMGDHPKVFTPLYLNMVRAGEASGSLETVLLRLADFTEKQEEMRSKVTTALAYPMVTGTVGAAVVALLMVKVVPNITQMFSDQGVELPLPTRLLMFVSDTIAGYWWAILALLAGAVWLFRRYRNSKEGRLTTDRILLRLPVIGDMARKIAIARFARTLSTMLASGVQLLQALDIVRSILGNVVLEKVVVQARDNIREGAGISSSLKQSGEFPPLVHHMVAVGERAGQLEQMLSDVADTYERETDTAINRAMTLLEPAMIVGMGGSVAFIVMAIMQPMLTLNQMAGK